MLWALLGLAIDAVKRRLFQPKIDKAEAERLRRELWTDGT